MFCPKCGSILVPKPDKKGKNLLSCSCGYKKKDVEEIKIKEQTKESAQIEVVEEKELLPLIDAECPKCHHTKAYHWIVQTRASDEAPTRFYKCEKCKHTWREYK
ncbi:transcription factor S [Candidatus Woesearchaeota archaeon]|nr:transcription factor S [Candidatus Woesearchaeota archaeon]